MRENEAEREELRSRSLHAATTGARNEIIGQLFVSLLCSSHAQTSRHSDWATDSRASTHSLAPQLTRSVAFGVNQLFALRVLVAPA